MRYCDCVSPPSVYTIPVYTRIVLYQALTGDNLVEVRHLLRGFLRRSLCTAAVTYCAPANQIRARIVCGGGAGRRSESELRMPCASMFRFESCGQHARAEAILSNRVAPSYFYIYIRSVCGREPFLSAAVRRVGIFAAEVMPTFGSSGGAASCQLTALFLSKFLGDCECFLWQIVQQQVAYCEVKPPDHVPIDGFDTFQRALRTPANRAPGALGFACLQGKLRTTSSTSTHTRRLRTWTLPAWRKSRMLSANLESNWRKRRTFSRRWGGYCTWGRSVPFVVRSRRCFGLRIAFFTAHFVRLTSWIHGKP